MSKDKEQDGRDKLTKTDIAKALSSALVIGYFLFDWRSLFLQIVDNHAQWLTLFVIIVWVLIANVERLTLKSVSEAILLTAGILLIFALLTGGRGCSGRHTYIDSDCSPAGPGIYNDC